MKKFIIIISVTFIAMACGDDFLDINSDPNNASEASIDLVLPSAQTFAAFRTSRDAHEFASIFVHHFYNLSESQFSIDPGEMDNDFTGLYVSVLKDFQVVIDQGSAEGFWGHVGIAKIHKAHIYSIMVDLWGDVPYSQALSGETNISPEYDDGAAIYADLHRVLDEAKVNLDSAMSQNLPPVANDLIYGGNTATTQFSNWKKVANTLKLKLYLTTRGVDASASTTGIEALIAEDDFIDDNSENFVFNFGANLAPINQHPIYQQDYAGAGDKTFYMNNYFMYKMLTKGDPRLNFYVYRQDVLGSLVFETTPCNARTDCTYWNLLSTDPANTGYIGRDGGDPSGIPGDNALRSTFGIYPIGGDYDDGSYGERTLGAGANGAGVVPWLTSSMRALMLAEAALVLGTTGDPQALLQEGIEHSISYVVNWSAALDAAVPAVDDSTYVANRMADYTGAATQNLALNVIIEEKYFSQYGNGIETYTDFRRTGMPLDLPDALVPQAPFPLRLPLGQQESTSNPNAPSVLVTEPVFWDVD